MVFFQGVALGTMLQWMVPHPEYMSSADWSLWAIKVSWVGVGERSWVWSELGGKLLIHRMVD